MNAPDKGRLVWIDGIKLMACVLVAVGHLYMSMVAGGWIPADAVYYCLPIQTVYAFHVPLFFVCSGLLYQRKKAEHSVREHVANVGNKALNLGIPYLTFSLITLLLKLLFPDAVHHKAPPIFRTLLAEPIAPYWYLYALFALFCIIPRQRSRKGLWVVFAVSAAAKLACVFVPLPFVLPDMVSKVAQNAIWFAVGMLLADEMLRPQLLNRFVGLTALAVGVVISTVFYRTEDSRPAIQLAVALAFVYFFVWLFERGRYEKIGGRILRLSQYFMPVYLMHTLAAAAVRTLLLRVGIDSLAVHLSVGLAASFLLPAVVYELAKRVWFLRFWFEPSTALCMRRNRNV